MQLKHPVENAWEISDDPSLLLTLSLPRFNCETPPSSSSSSSYRGKYFFVDMTRVIIAEGGGGSYIKGWREVLELCHGVESREEKREGGRGKDGSLLLKRR